MLVVVAADFIMEEVLVEQVAPEVAVLVEMEHRELQEVLILAVVLVVPDWVL